jgi:hypothetical protein
VVFALLPNSLSIGAVLPAGTRISLVLLLLTERPGRYLLPLGFLGC